MEPAPAPDDVLAYFSHRASNGPTEAINGRLEALRPNARGFRNQINYRIRFTAALRSTRTLKPEEPLYVLALSGERISALTRYENGALPRIPAAVGAPQSEPALRV